MGSARQAGDPPGSVDGQVQPAPVGEDEPTDLTLGCDRVVVGPDAAAAGDTRDGDRPGEGQPRSRSLQPSRVRGSAAEPRSRPVARSPRSVTIRSYMRA